MAGMIKQIAGRAGRRSSRYPNGEVTCYKGEDMVHLRAGLNTPTQRLVRCVRACVRACTCACVPAYLPACRPCPCV